MFSLLAFLQLSAPVLADDDDEAGVKVTVLVSEGLLIQSADAVVLIDAFIDPRRSKSDSELIAVQRDMLAGEPPFSSIQLALVSHPHHDHFHAPTAGAFLKSHPETILASSPEVIEAIRIEYIGYPSVKDQLKKIKTKKGKLSSFSHADIGVKLIPFSHEASALYPEQVLGHIIYLAGRKLLYIGDAEMRFENWEPFDLKSLEIDAALAPFWLFREPITRKIIKEQVAPRKTIVVQIPPKGLKDKLTELSKELPEVIFLSEAMASIEL
ncbi:MAG: MBL fold metallo-hydrolase [Candidatus Zixiibacteriota bacterium]